MLWISNEMLATYSDARCWLPLLTMWPARTMNRVLDYAQLPGDTHHARKKIQRAEKNGHISIRRSRLTTWIQRCCCSFPYGFDENESKITFGSYPSSVWHLYMQQYLLFLRFFSHPSLQSTTVAIAVLLTTHFATGPPGRCNMSTQTAALEVNSTPATNFNTAPRAVRLACVPVFA